MKTRPRGFRLVPVLASAASAALLSLAPSASLADEGIIIPPPFQFSGTVAQGRGPEAARAANGAAVFAGAPRSTATASVSVGANVNVIGKFDVVQQETINGVAVKTCNPGMKTAQNETTIAANPENSANLVGGANDYRLYEPSENRYDSSGGFYQSADGGASWTAGLLPGLVRGNTEAPGPYESAGDPAVAAGPGGNFWYGNIAFNRTDAANAISASHSSNGGATWTTSFVFSTSAAGGATVFNDKDWIAADPTDGNTAYVTWTQFHTNALGHYLSSPIVLSKTTNGGATWSAPIEVSGRFVRSQGSVVQVVGNTVHVTFETFSGGRNWLAYSQSTDGGATFTSRLLAVINDIPSPLPGATYRTDSFPGFGIDGSTLHVVWSNWTGTNAQVVYTASRDGGATWTSPVSISGSTGDQFFPWVAARSGKVYVSWFDRAPGGANTYDIAGAASINAGGSWTAPFRITTATSDVSQGNLFRFPVCQASFVGDYNGIAVDSNGVGHPLWTDVRDRNSDTNQDPYTATITVG